MNVRQQLPVSYDLYAKNRREEMGNTEENQKDDGPALYLGHCLPSPTLYILHWMNCEKTWSYYRATKKWGTGTRWDLLSPSLSSPNNLLQNLEKKGGESNSVSESKRWLWLEHCQPVLEEDYYYSVCQRIWLFFSLTCSLQQTFGYY